MLLELGQMNGGVQHSAPPAGSGAECRQWSSQLATDLIGAVVRRANRSHVEHEWLASQGKGDVFQGHTVGCY